MGIFYTSAVFIIVITYVTGVNSAEECTSLQYLELWKSGLVYCTFRDSFYGVYWYNSTNVAEDPIVFLKDFVKGGSGYNSGEFDVNSDGSLKINNVTLDHEKVFAVMKFTSSKDEPSFFTVRVITIVKPHSSYPVIVGCDNKREVCFKHVENGSELKCLVKDSRPAVNLRWHVKTTLGDRNIPSLTTISNGSIVQTSCAYTFAAFTYTNLLSLLVCRANGTGELIDQTESEVLVLSKTVNCLSPVSNIQYFQRNENLLLKCGDEKMDHAFVVWMRRIKSNCVHLLHASHDFTQRNFDDLELAQRGSLVIPHAGTQHEGSYYCIFGNGMTDSSFAVDIVLYERPFPPYLVINDCNLPKSCIFQVQTKDFIKCSAYGIRPLIQLDIRVVDAELSSLIVFTNKTLDVRESGDTFDITLTVEFIVQSQPHRRLTLICAASGPSTEVFQFSTEFELSFVDETNGETPFPSQVQPIFLIVVVLSLVVVFVLLAVFGCILWKAYRRSKEMVRRNKAESTEETSEMLMVSKHGGYENFIPDDWSTPPKSHSLVCTICKRLYEETERKYSLLENQALYKNAGEEDLCVVILGKSGVGKSATANTLLGEHVFDNDMGTLHTTVSSCFGCRKVGQRNINIIDTKGLFDCDRRKDNIHEDIAAIISKFRNGLHAFIYVFSIAAPRFTKDDLEAVRTVEEAFGKRSTNYRGIVFSHADSLDNKMDLEQFWSKQRKGRDEIASFFHKFETRVVAVNNKSKVPLEKKRNQDVIIKLIDSVQAINNNMAFSNEKFQTALTERKKLSKKVKSKNWSGVIVTSVENVITAYPHLKESNDEFIEKVTEEVILQSKSYDEEMKKKHKDYFNFKRRTGKQHFILVNYMTKGDMENDDAKLRKQVVEVHQELKVMLLAIKESLDSS